LLHHFGTLKEIERASIADLGKFPASALKRPQDFRVFSTPRRLKGLVQALPATDHREPAG